MKKTLQAALAVLAFTFLASCASQRLPLPQTGDSPGCLALTPPMTVTCFVQGHALVSGPTQLLCEKSGPHRWLLRSASIDGHPPQELTLVGADCFVGIDGHY